MSISGAHVQCGYVQGVRGAMLFTPIWSESIALGAMTTQVAPQTETPGILVFRVRAPASGEMFSAFGTSPDATQAISSTQNNARSHHIASEEKDIPAIVGWKCAVAAA